MFSELENDWTIDGALTRMILLVIAYLMRYKN